MTPFKKHILHFLIFLYVGCVVAQEYDDVYFTKKDRKKLIEKKKEATKKYYLPETVTPLSDIKVNKNYTSPDSFTRSFEATNRYNYYNKPFRTNRRRSRIQDIQNENNTMVNNSNYYSNNSWNRGRVRTYSGFGYNSGWGYPFGWNNRSYDWNRWNYGYGWGSGFGSCDPYFSSPWNDYSVSWGWGLGFGWTWGGSDYNYGGGYHRPYYTSYGYRDYGNGYRRYNRSNDRGVYVIERGARAQRGGRVVNYSSGSISSSGRNVYTEEDYPYRQNEREGMDSFYEEGAYDEEAYDPEVYEDQRNGYQRSQIITNSRGYNSSTSSSRISNSKYGISSSGRLSPGVSSGFRNQESSGVSSPRGSKSSSGRARRN